MAPPSKRNKLTYAQKLEIVKEVEKGGKKAHIAQKYGLNESTIRTIFKDREKIRKVLKGNPGQGSLDAFKVANPVLKTTEKLVGRYVTRQHRNGVPIDGKAIREKSKILYQQVATKLNMANPPPFQASQGWLWSFLKRHKLKNVRITGEAASADTEAAHNYPVFLRQVIEEGGYTADQIFNADETGLFWKTMPKRTYIHKQQKSAKGFKSAKDRVTLMLTCNASGTCKLKPLVIHRAKKPRPYKHDNMPRLNVHWMSNKKAWMSTALNIEWFDRCLVPALEEFCKQKNLAFKILFLLDNAPGHSPLLVDRHPAVKVMFMPPNTSLLQPLDQEIIVNLKASYATKTFRLLDSATDTQEEIEQLSDVESSQDTPPAAKPEQAPDTEAESLPNTDDPDISEPTPDPATMTMYQFWKKNNIKTTINLLAESWNELNQATITHAWRNVLEGLPGHTVDVPGERQTVQAAVEQAVVAARNVAGLSELNAEDIRELIVPIDQDQDELLNEFEEEMEEQPGTGAVVEEEVPVGEPTTRTLRQMIELVDKLYHMVENDDPDAERATAVTELLQNVRRNYTGMFIERVNARQQLKITEFFRARQGQEEQQQEQQASESDDDLPSDVDVDDAMSLFSGFGDDDEHRGRPSTSSQ